MQDATLYDYYVKPWNIPLWNAKNSHHPLSVIPEISEWTPNPLLVVGVDLRVSRRLFDPDVHGQPLQPGTRPLRFDRNKYTHANTWLLHPKKIPICASFAARHSGRVLSHNRTPEDEIRAQELETMTPWRRTLNAIKDNARDLCDPRIWTDTKPIVIRERTRLFDSCAVYLLSQDEYEGIWEMRESWRKNPPPYRVTSVGTRRENGRLQNAGRNCGYFNLEQLQAANRAMPLYMYVLPFPIIFAGHINRMRHSGIETPRARYFDEHDLAPMHTKRLASRPVSAAPQPSADLLLKAVA